MADTDIQSTKTVEQRDDKVQNPGEMIPRQWPQCGDKKGSYEWRKSVKGDRSKLERGKRLKNK